MCLGIPMQVTSINGFTAHCSAKGVEREVSLLMLQDDGIQVGDYVMVHLGYAIQRMEEEEAQKTWALLDEMLAAEGGGTR